MKIRRLGIFIGRLNPPHMGHVGIIDKALEENDKVILYIGDKGLRDENNPFSVDEIIEILGEKYEYNEERFQAKKLSDYRTDRGWIKNLNVEFFLAYYNTSSEEDGFDELNCYFGDFGSDSAYRTMQDYSDLLNTYTLSGASHDYNIHYIEVPRKDSFIEYEGKRYEISGTNLRLALREGKYLLAEKFCDIKMFQKILEFSKKNIKGQVRSS